MSESFWLPPAGALPSGARFAVTTRLGGVSEEPFATLNLGLGVGDREEAVRENVRRVRAGLGLAEDEPRRLRQVHGDLIARPGGAGAAGARADGFLLQAGDPWASVTVADCAPVAVVAGGGEAGALLHAGWRGTRRGIVTRAVQLLAAAGVCPSRLHVVIGPCIHVCCYPVGPEVARAFPVSCVQPRADGGFALDLPAALAESLRNAGVPRGQITASSECTACRRDRYYSHRRDAGRTGRHWALLRLGAPGGPSPSPPRDPRAAAP